MGLATMILLIFIIMVAFFISYGKTFRLKNALINRIEQSEGMTKTQMQTFISTAHSATVSYSGREVSACYNKIMNGTDFVGVTFEVVVYMKFEQSILGDSLSLEIPITGESRIIEKGNFYDVVKNPFASVGLKECSVGMEKIQG